MKFKVDYKVNGTESSDVVEASNRVKAEEIMIKKLINDGYTEGQILKVTQLKKEVI